MNMLKARELAEECRLSVLFLVYYVSVAMVS